MLCFGSSCGFSVYHHDPLQAARVAEVFVNDAFVKRNYIQASKDAVFDEDAIQRLFVRIHPDGERPTAVSANAFEPGPPGSDMIRIYVDGVSIHYQDFHYLVTLNLSTASKYVVSDVTRVEPIERFRKPSLRRSLLPGTGNSTGKKMSFDALRPLRNGSS
jgi:hypothetical protein